MKRPVPVIILTLLAMSAPPAARAQDSPPDFSGTWVLERAEGDLPERAANALAKGSRQPMTLVIVQSATELQVTRETDRGRVTASYPLDGTNATQATPHGSMTSRTRWDVPSLVTSGTRPLPGPLGTRSVEFIETRTLSGDGDRLTVEVRLKTPRGEKTRIATFRREG
jgi:hypothetical protein